jgi:hypothetical protein
LALHLTTFGNKELEEVWGESLAFLNGGTVSDKTKISELAQDYGGPSRTMALLDVAQTVVLEMALRLREELFGLARHMKEDV